MDIRCLAGKILQVELSSLLRNVKFWITIAKQRFLLDGFLFSDDNAAAVFQKLIYHDAVKSYNPIYVFTQRLPYVVAEIKVALKFIQLAQLYDYTFVLFELQEY